MPLYDYISFEMTIQKYQHFAALLSLACIYSRSMPNSRPL